MPILASAAKRARQAERRRLRNLAVRTAIKSVRRRLFEAVQRKDNETAEKVCREYFSLLDKSAKKGVIKKNTALRRKARAAAMVRRIG